MKYVDMHSDTITGLFVENKNLFENDYHIDIQKMIKGDCLLQNFAIFTDIKRCDSKFTYDSIDFYYKQLETYKDYIAPVYKYEDIENNLKNNKISALLTLEEGSVVDGDLNNLNRFYDLGVRMITLTWNYENGIGFPNFVAKKQRDHTSLHLTNKVDGLTPFGKEFVKKCNELGIIVDVSHLSDAGFYDVVNCCKGPFVASHSNARKVCNVARNLDDDMIRKLADKGGVTGLNYCASFIKEGEEVYTKIEDMVKHIRHIANVGGIDCIGLGSDFDGIGSTLEIKDASGMPLLADALRPYFNEDEIEKIFYKNVLRVYKEVFK